MYSKNRKRSNCTIKIFMRYRKKGHYSESKLEEDRRKFEMEMQRMMHKQQQSSKVISNLSCISCTYKCCLKIK